MVNFLVVTHGEFGAYLIEAAEAIVGVQPDGVRSIPISPRHTIDEIRQKLSSELEDLRRGGAGVVVAADMPGGTPTNVTMPLIKDMPDVEMVTGVNLYMLVGAFTRRGTMSASELAKRMVEDGRKSVHDMKHLLESARSKA